MWHSCGVDSDAFAEAHAREWERLDELSRRRRLTGAEADELAALYRTAAGHLSRIQTQAPDQNLIARLSTTVGEARARIATQPGIRPRDVARFFLVTVPAGFYRVRWWTIGVGLAFLLIAFSAGWWFTQSAELRASLGTVADFERYADEMFAAYYSEHPAPDFAMNVWTNNAWIAFQAVAAGLTGFWPIYLLWQNALGVGQAGGIMTMYGDPGVFYGLILPHGLLEISAIFVAIGAGLKLFWTLLVPGPRTRLRALKEEGTRLFAVGVGLVAVFLVAGIIEAFVTPSGLPGWAKITIGAIALAGYWVFTLTLGRRAVRLGELGDPTEERGGYVVLEAA